MLRQVLKVSLEFRINFNKLKMCVFEINDFVSTNYSKIPPSNLIWVDLKFGLKQQKYFSLDENIPRHPESLRFVFKTLEARKTKSGLSALPRPSLDNEELVSLPTSEIFSYAVKYFSVVENARLQEDTAGFDLPHLQHDPPQLCPLVGHLAHLLLRVRGTSLGHRQTGQSEIFLFLY